MYLDLIFMKISYFFLSMYLCNVKLIRSVVPSKVLRRLLFVPVLRQEDKEPVFDSVKTILGMLEVSAEFAQNITFNRDRIKKALPAGHLDATTLADYLVKKASFFNLICSTI